MILLPSLGRSFNAFSEVFPGRGGLKNSIHCALNDFFLYFTGASALSWRIGGLGQCRCVFDTMKCLFPDPIIAPPCPEKALSCP